MAPPPHILNPTQRPRNLPARERDQPLRRIVLKHCMAAAGEEGSIAVMRGALKTTGVERGALPAGQPPLPYQERDINRQMEAVVTGYAAVAEGGGEGKLLPLPQGYVDSILALKRQTWPTPGDLDHLSPDKRLKCEEMAAFYKMLDDDFEQFQAKSVMMLRRMAATSSTRATSPVRPGYGLWSRKNGPSLTSVAWMLGSGMRRRAASKPVKFDSKLMADDERTPPSSLKARIGNPKSAFWKSFKSDLVDGVLYEREV
ncbi:hypothetical protein E2562_037692 [Oryza meyeriana var. granulata]|uniref:Uncharacterized protein n=1 Tax=Oryza meyeriana var. granulata TaxID=110450 RepID=A0A6G1ECL9_9ORYZ|nr:hypothetical protein E2562_037692 [Oryza meyeriana var. granulata]